MPVITGSARPTTMASTPHHFGAMPSSARRIIRKYSTSTTANTMQPMNSSVIPEVMWPKPLKMRSQCCRCMNTDSPPTTSAASAVTSDASCIFLPLPMTFSRPCAPSAPPATHRKKVKRIRGHSGCIVYSLHFRPSRMRYMSFGSLPTSARWWISFSVYGST